ncbi:sel1 repeat family protein [Pelomyxa schiedti]|nr:sel1 repeat family protein [Pelomyxa schiedti]
MMWFQGHDWVTTVLLKKTEHFKYKFFLGDDKYPPGILQWEHGADRSTDNISCIEASGGGSETPYPLTWVSTARAVCMWALGKVSQAISELENVLQFSPPQALASTLRSRSTDSLNLTSTTYATNLTQGPTLRSSAGRVPSEFQPSKGLIGNQPTSPALASSTSFFRDRDSVDHEPLPKSVPDKAIVQENTRRFLPAIVSLYCAYTETRMWINRQRALMLLEEQLCDSQSLPDPPFSFWVLFKTAIGRGSALYFLIRGHYLQLLSLPLHSATSTTLYPAIATPFGNTTANNNGGGSSNPTSKPAYEMIECSILLREAAAQGSSHAEVTLGWLLYVGADGIAVDIPNSLAYLENSANKGNASAQYYLATLTFPHIPRPPPIQPFSGGHICTHSNLGMPLNTDPKFVWLHHSYVQRYPPAYFALGLLYDTGTAGLRQCSKCALDLYTRAANAGHPESQLKLGDLALAQNPAEAMAHYTEAANAGNVDAQIKLAWSYVTGQGTTSDLKRAFLWFHRAANKGSMEAQYNLGVCYKVGYGTAPCEQEAISWWHKAFCSGFVPATFCLATLHKPENAKQQKDRVSVLWVGSRYGFSPAVRLYAKHLAAMQNKQDLANFYSNAHEIASLAVKAAAPKDPPLPILPYPVLKSLVPAGFSAGEYRLDNTECAQFQDIPLCCAACHSLALSNVLHQCNNQSRRIHLYSVVLRGEETYLSTSKAILKWSCNSLSVVSWNPAPLLTICASETFLCFCYQNSALFVRHFSDQSNQSLDRTATPIPATATCNQDSVAFTTSSGFLFVSKDFTTSKVNRISALSPVLLLAHKIIDIVACGEQFIIATSQDKMTFSWGINGKGQLGLGSTSTSFSTPQEITALFGVSISAISCGTAHTIAITQDGCVYSWGGNSLGQLGLGHFDDAYAPQTIPFFVGAADWASQVACGEDTSSLVTFAGRLYFWGCWSAIARLESPHCIPALVQSTKKIVSVACQNTRVVVISDGSVSSPSRSSTSGTKPEESSPCVPQTAGHLPDELHNHAQTTITIIFSLVLNYIPLSCVRNFACSSRLFYFIAISTVKKESFWCAQYHQRFGASYLHKPIRSWKSAYKDFHRGMRATGSHLVWIILPALINCTIRKDDLYKCLSCKDFISTITDVGQHETIQFILHRELDTLISAQLEKTHKKFRHYLSDHDHVVCNAKAFIKHFLSKRKKVHRSCQDFSEDFTQICDFIKTGWDTYFFLPLKESLATAVDICFSTPRSFSDHIQHPKCICGRLPGNILEECSEILSTLNESEKGTCTGNGLTSLDIHHLP